MSMTNGLRGLSHRGVDSPTAPARTSGCYGYNVRDRGFQQVVSDVVLRSARRLWLHSHRPSREHQSATDPADTSGIRVRTQWLRWQRIRIASPD